MTTTEIPATAESMEPAVQETSTEDRPNGLPDKFWDEEQASVRTDALVKSYLGLEKRFGGLETNGVPENANDYAINPSSELVQPDAALNARLHGAGFTQNQAELVYELASEYLHPLVSQMSDEMAAQHQIGRLADEFGGEEKWREVSTQLANWGKANYAPEVYQAMASSTDGVRTMYKSMTKNEPGMLGQHEGSGGSLNENGLKSLMRDPKYWRDQDPAVVAQVREGFSKLYPGEG